MASLRCFVVVVAPLVLLSACGGSESPDPTPEVVTQAGETQTVIAPEPVLDPTTTAETVPDPTATTVEPATATPDPKGAEALAVVNAFDPDSPESMHWLNEVVATGGGIVPALAPLLDDDNPDRRWAALYVVALVTGTPEEIEILKAVLDDPELVHRVHAAGSLAKFGVLEAIPILIEGVSSDLEMPFSAPPLPVAEHARGTLEHYTGQSFADAADWRAWWDRVNVSIEWNGERYVTE